VSFWDSSALVPLLVREGTSGAIRKRYRRDEAPIVWWCAEVECASAVARLERDGSLSSRGATDAFHRLDTLVRAWHLIEPVAAVRETARRFLRVHDLRAGDALQLGAALVAAEGRSSTLELICLDERLSAAAQREGFAVVGRSDL